MTLLEPREDVRPPTFANGPLFGTVPHTRVILFTTATHAPYSFLNDGIVIEWADGYWDEEGVGIQNWRGERVIAGTLFEARYWWSGMGLSDGQITVSIQLTERDGPTFTSWSSDMILPELAKTIPLPRVVDTSAGKFGDSAQKIDVPEWSDVVSRWPNALAFPLPE